MKRHLWFLLTSFLLMLLQITFFTGIKAGYIVVDFLTPFIVWWSLRTPLPEGILTVLAAGILADTLSALPPGLFIFAWSLGYLTTRYIARHLNGTTMWHNMFITGFVTMETVVILQVGSQAIDLVWPWGIGQALLNSVLTSLFFRFFDFFADNPEDEAAPEKI
jgi:rod shape-determining protein MreD